MQLQNIVNDKECVVTDLWPLVHIIMVGLILRVKLWPIYTPKEWMVIELLAVERGKIAILVTSAWNGLFHFLKSTLWAVRFSYALSGSVEETNCSQGTWNAIFWSQKFLSAAKHDSLFCCSKFGWILTVLKFSICIIHGTENAQKGVQICHDICTIRQVGFCTEENQN